jgi:hypothetical protein
MGRSSNSLSESSKGTPTKRGIGNTISFSTRENASKYGIDCGPDLLWKGWTIGGEYTKKIVIKNISTKTVEIRCKIPASVDFFMEYPDWFKLSPGVSQAIDVTFRPTEYVRTYVLDSLNLLEKILR